MQGLQLAVTDGDRFAEGAALWTYDRGGTTVPIPGGLATVSGCVVTVVATGQGVSIAGALAAFGAEATNPPQTRTAQVQTKAGGSYSYGYSFSYADSYAYAYA